MLLHTGVPEPSPSPWSPTWGNMHGAAAVNQATVDLTRNRFPPWPGSPVRACSADRYHSSVHSMGLLCGYEEMVMAEKKILQIEEF